MIFVVVSVSRKAEPGQLTSIEVPSACHAAIDLAYKTCQMGMPFCIFAVFFFEICFAAVQATCIAIALAKFACNARYALVLLVTCYT